MSEKLAAALRRHQESALKAKVTAYLKERANLDATQYTWIDMDTTTHVRAKFIEARQEIKGRDEIMVYREHEMPLISATLKILRGKALGKPLIMLHSLSEEVGAIRIQDIALIDRILDLISLDQDEVHALTEPGGDGFAFSFNTNYTESGPDRVYEYYAWGCYK